MAWYDTFSTFYDRSLEKLYAPYRAEAFAELSLGDDDLVLDLACGTAQNFSALGCSETGATYVGVDKSSGMLRAAKARVDGFPRAHFLEKAIVDVGSADLEALAHRPQATHLLCTLGLTVLPDWEQQWAHAWTLLAPGGRAIVMDVVATKRTFQTWMVERMAQADLSREVWRPLGANGEGFSRTETTAPPSKMGGTLFFASAKKPS